MKHVFMILCAALISTQALAGAKINGDLDAQNAPLQRTAASDAPTPPSGAACNCTGDRESTSVADNLTPLIHAPEVAAQLNNTATGGTKSVH